MNNLIPQFEQALAQARTVEEARDGYDKLKALSEYFEKDYEKAFPCTVNMIEYACRGGELLAEIDGQQGARHDLGLTSFQAGTKLKRERVEEMGLSWVTAHRWEKMALIPKDRRQEYYANLWEQRELPTISGTLNLAKIPLSQPMQILLSHEAVEYYTPSEIIEAARQVMGGIDLDPASCEAAQKIVKAGDLYTEQDNGLSQPWFGRVWLNPPYSKTGGRSNQEIWAEYLMSEFEKGNVSQAHLLVKSALGYKWFELLWDKLPVCFIRERLSFTKSNGDSSGESKHGTAIFYFGDELSRFIQIFSLFGRITTPDGQYINT